MKDEPFCALFAARIAEIRSALREKTQGLSCGENGLPHGTGHPQESLASLLDGIERRLAELSGLCPAAAQGPDEAARDALSRVLAEIGGRRGRGLLPDSLAWVSG